MLYNLPSRWRTAVGPSFAEYDMLWVMAALVPLGVASAAWALQMSCGFCSVEPPEFWLAVTTIVLIATANAVLRMVLQITGSASIYQDVPEGYLAISGGRIFGLSNQVYIALAVLVVAHVFLRHTEPGRYMYAIGGNPEAARLSGVPIRLLKAVGFAVVGLAAALTGVLLTSQAGAANPNTGLGFLLPAYAAAFLGSSMFRLGTFSAVGTALGALFLQIIGSGLTVLNLSGPLVQIIQGGILAAAILLARLNRRAD